MNKNINNKTKANHPKLKKQNIIILILILLIILVTLTYIFLLIFGNKNNDSKLNNNNSNNNTNIYTEEEIKLKELDNINKRIDFFNMEYLDRYLNYKRNNPDIDIEKVIVYVNIGLDQNFYTNDKESPNQDTNTVLVNKFNYLSKDYVPKDLETINSNYSSGNKLMEKNTRIAFERMAKDAQSEGYTIRAVSTYRSYSYQANLYSNYVKSDGIEMADTYSAKAGYSEHQTGLAVDVDNKTKSYTSFGSTKEFSWMQENAHKYGFILRYTKDNEFITGYKDEPWHYRYVGVEIATYIHNNPMTYEEYYVRFLGK